MELRYHISFGEDLENFYIVDSSDDVQMNCFKLENFENVTRYSLSDNTHFLVIDTSAKATDLVDGTDKTVSKWHIFCSKPVFVQKIDKTIDGLLTNFQVTYYDENTI